MTVGMLMAAIAFVCAGLVQIEIDVSRKKFMKLTIKKLEINSQLRFI